MNQSEAEEIGRHLVDDVSRATHLGTNPLQILRAECVKLLILMAGFGLCRPARQGLPPIGQLTGAPDHRMRGQNLFRQGSSGSWHPDNEYGLGTHFDRVTAPIDPFPAGRPQQPCDEAMKLPAVIAGRVALLEVVGALVMTEGP